MNKSVSPIIIDDFSDFSDFSTTKEWILTNGIGGYASSTVTGLNSRRYHGLLVAPLNPPYQRTLLIAKVEDRACVEGENMELSTNEYKQTIHPDGYKNLYRVSIFHDKIVWDFGTLEKSVEIVKGENTVIVTYKSKIDTDILLELSPLLNARDFHSETVASSISFDTEILSTNSRVVTAENIGQKIYINASKGKFVPADYWYYDFYYRYEDERGLNPIDNHYCPFTIVGCLKGFEELTLRFSTCEESEADYCPYFSEDTFLEISKEENEDIRRLMLTAESFVVDRGYNGDKTIIAGYHWFGDWGRDTAIAIPGLLFPLRQYETARNIFFTWAKNIKNGLIPNLFSDDNGGGAYNSVDAPLLFINTLNEYILSSGDEKIAEELETYLREIVSNYIKGTDFGIIMDNEDGLIKTTSKEWQLTWMDAKIGDYVVTPRGGKAVEINALWYNALKFFNDFGLTREHESLAEKVKASFNEKFWCEDKGYLYDTISDDCANDVLRPNQLFALSLRHSLIEDRGKARQIVDTVTTNLLTPYGLRSLSPADNMYRPEYVGDVWSRDTAYHQGTVWAWLIGSYIDAYLYAYGNSGEEKRRCRELLNPLFEHTKSAACINSVSEIFDADFPHLPKGTVSQAWSVSEILRVWQKIK